VIQPKDFQDKRRNGMNNKMKALLLIILSLTINSVSADINDVHKILIEKDFNKAPNEKGKDSALSWLSRFLHDDFLIKKEEENTVISKSILEKEGDQIDGIRIAYSKESLNFDYRASLYLFVLIVKGETISQSSTQDATTQINLLANRIFNSVLASKFKKNSGFPPREDAKERKTSDEDFLKEVEEIVKGNTDGTEVPPVEQIPPVEPVEIDLTFVFDKEVNGYKLFKLSNQLEHNHTWMYGLKVAIKGQDVIFMGKISQGFQAHEPEDRFSIESNKVWFNRVLRLKDGTIIKP
jgi:hypothetical protein